MVFENALYSTHKHVYYLGLSTPLFALITAPEENQLSGPELQIYIAKLRITHWWYQKLIFFESTHTCPSVQPSSHFYTCMSCPNNSEAETQTGQVWFNYHLRRKLSSDWLSMCCKHTTKRRQYSLCNFFFFHTDFFSARKI